MGGATGLEFLSHLHARLLVTAAASFREWLALASVSLWHSAVSLHAEVKGGAPGLEFLSHSHARLLVTAAVSIRDWLVLASLWDSAVSLHVEEKENANPRAALCLNISNRILGRKKIAHSLHLLVFERLRDSWVTVCPPFFHPSMALLSLSPSEGRV